MFFFYTTVIITLLDIACIVLLTHYFNIKTKYKTLLLYACIAAYANFSTFVAFPSFKVLDLVNILVFLIITIISVSYYNENYFIFKIFLKHRRLPTSAIKTPMHSQNILLLPSINTAKTSSIRLPKYLQQSFTLVHKYFYSNHTNYCLEYLNEQLINFAFTEANKKHYDKALYLYHNALIYYKNNDYAIFIIISIANIYKAQGKYISACHIYNNSLSLPIINNNHLVQTEFKKTLYYLHILQYVLQRYHLSNMPFAAIPALYINKVEDIFQRKFSQQQHFSNKHLPILQLTMTNKSA
ncbi:hypothetical protein [Pectinatus brassicae]|uniref:Tetratricopeptide (TPR) repeat protein n=1 Tax=Pectinatus brassicae TaxID=862415 RepID=A0A840ULV4_9FIRM|nr:hypothetical protein [Pectinatus brassicae]MBB5336767.1 tetratricopeptide (TPR) repeat protein [Pectinatus brassicae]